MLTITLSHPFVPSCILLRATKMSGLIAQVGTGQRHQDKVDQKEGPAFHPPKVANREEHCGEKHDEEDHTGNTAVLPDSTLGDCSMRLASSNLSVSVSGATCQVDLTSHAQSLADLAQLRPCAREKSAN